MLIDKLSNNTILNVLLTLPYYIDLPLQDENIFYSVSNIISTKNRGAHKVQ